MFNRKTAVSTPAPAPGTANSGLLNNIPFAEHLPAPVRDFVARRPGTAIGIAVLAGLGLMVAKRRPRHV